MPAQRSARVRNSQTEHIASPLEVPKHQMHVESVEKRGQKQEGAEALWPAAGAGRRQCLRTTMPWLRTVDAQKKKDAHLGYQPIMSQKNLVCSPASRQGGRAIRKVHEMLQPEKEFRGEWGGKVLTTRLSSGRDGSPASPSTWQSTSARAGWG